jgi:hypothetical protein
LLVLDARLLFFDGLAFFADIGVSFLGLDEFSEPLLKPSRPAQFLVVSELSFPDVAVTVGANPRTAGNVLITCAAQFQILPMARETARTQPVNRMTLLDVRLRLLIALVVYFLLRLAR